LATGLLVLLRHLRWRPEGNLTSQSRIPASPNIHKALLSTQSYFQGEKTAKYSFADS